MIEISFVQRNYRGILLGNAQGYGSGLPACTVHYLPGRRSGPVFDVRGRRSGETRENRSSENRRNYVERIHASAFWRVAALTDWMRAAGVMQYLEAAGIGFGRGCGPRCR